MVESTQNDAIKELRRLILEEIASGKTQSSVGAFHSSDIKRIHNDEWLDNFLNFHDYDVKKAFDQCWATLIWRTENGVNDINESNIKNEDLVNGNIYIRGRDVDGKHIMFFRIRMYSRGDRKIEELQKFFLYWVERGLRLSKGDQMSLVLDMQGAGIKNMDLEYTRMMISIFKNYYPNSMNYMLVYEMPYLMNGIFQIIKGLLPKKVLDRMKFINSKTANTYISELHQPKEWGGLDDFELKFIPEEFKKSHDDHDSDNNNNNNNRLSLTNLNSSKLLENKKVHFASAFQENSPMSEASLFENHHFGDMLSLSPVETIIFQRGSNGSEYAGNVEITNVSKKPLTYKVKTTAPDKFRVRPSSGTLSPTNSATINVVIQKGQQALPINKDKFLVMCMSLPDGESLTNDEIANLWKEVTAASSDVEQHRLKCAISMNSTNNSDMLGDYFVDSNSSAISSSLGHHPGLSSATLQNGTKQNMTQNHLQATVNHLSETINLMQQQMRSLQSLQWITIFVFVMLAIAIIYILKMEIQNQNSQYCIDK